jgi:Ca2+-binding EF-hand superfamily protein
MKIFPFSLIAACVLVTGQVMAQAPVGPPAEMPVRDGAEKRNGARPFMEAWKAVDLDHDGFISKEEFDTLPRLGKLPEEKRRNLFMRLDKDQNGKLSREELGKMGQPMLRLWELDVDKSRGISLEEFKAGRLFSKLPPEKQDNLFRRLDTDHDGVITPKDKPERPFKHEGGNPHQGRPDFNKSEGPHNGPRMEPRQIIRKLDKDGDGALSFEEFRVGPMVRDLGEDAQEDRFEEMDRNHDQKITAEDFTPPQPRGEDKTSKRPDPPPVGEGSLNR